MTGFKIALRQTGGKRARMISTTPVTDGTMFSFLVLEDATFTTLTAAAGDDSIKDMDYATVFVAGTTVFTPNIAQNITLASGKIIAYEE